MIFNSGARVKKLTPKIVSALVVNTFIFSLLFSISNVINAPSDLPIQFFCCSFKDEEKSKILDYGKNLAGNVKQEFKLEPDIIKSSGLGNFLSTAARKWIEISKINTGPLFRRFKKGSNLSDHRLTDQTVALLIKEYLKLAGIDSKNYSGHSLRSGFATSAAEAGAEERSIMAMTGHKSTEMVRRYIKEANIFKNNALNKIKI